MLLLLAACVVPEFHPPQETITESEQAMLPAQDLQTGPTFSIPVKTVSSVNKENQYYGYDEANQLAYFETPTANWNLAYDRGKLVKISGPRQISFEYDNGKLTKIHEKEDTPLFYDEKGRLIQMQTEESIHYVYDSKDHIRQVRRGVAGQTSIDYDKQNRTQYLTRGSIKTEIRYDEKNRLRLFDHGDSHIALGYWRDNKLIKLTGSTLGKGIEVSYGPEPTPNMAQIIAAEDTTRFTAPDKETLYNAVDLYLYCNYVRRLPVDFDGVSYTIVREYFNESLQDYVIKNNICVIYETAS